MSPLTAAPIQLLAFATQGSGGNDEARLRALLESIPGNVEFFPYDYRHKIKSAWGVFRQISRTRPQLVVMEGTGLFGGIAVLLGRFLLRTPYVVSSGDAIAAFVAAQAPLLYPLFWCFEKCLTRFSKGFIGWTPYLSGRALTFGARRVMTASGWAPAVLSPEERKAVRTAMRKELGIREDELVVGIVGSLAWNKRVGFCYGYELARIFERLSRQDTRVLIVGDGTGRPHLEALAGKHLGHGILLTGNRPRAQIPALLAAMDIASLPQSVDQVGSFRYTTKLTEYLAAGLPILLGEVPMSYDLPGEWFWRLPGDTPWSDSTVAAGAALLDDLTPQELASKRAQVPATLPTFEKKFQVERVKEFIEGLVRNAN